MKKLGLMAAGLLLSAGLIAFASASTDGDKKQDCSKASCQQSCDKASCDTTNCPMPCCPPCK